MSKRQSPTRKTTRTRTARTRDPQGGLTPAGRAEFARRGGSHLKPGVKKAQRDMTPVEMRRKGSWAVRFYGRAGTLPPLVGDDGKPTRFALTARAWGEPVPRTPAAARRIAEKGRRLLERANQATASRNTTKKTTAPTATARKAARRKPTARTKR